MRKDGKVIVSENEVDVGPRSGYEPVDWYLLMLTPLSYPP